MQAYLLAVAYFISIDVRGILLLLHPTDYKPQNWHCFVIIIGIAMSSCSIAVFGKKKLPTVVTVFVVYHFLLFVGIIATILTLGTSASNAFVWQNQVSLGGWSDSSVSFCLGLVGLTFTLAGKSLPRLPDRLLLIS